MFVVLFLLIVPCYLQSYDFSVKPESIYEPEIERPRANVDLFHGSYSYVVSIPLLEGVEKLSAQIAVGSFVQSDGINEIALPQVSIIGAKNFINYNDGLGHHLELKNNGDNKYYFKEFFRKLPNNLYHQSIGGLTHPVHTTGFREGNRNYYTITTPDKRVRKYKSYQCIHPIYFYYRCHLISEITPSRHRLLYSYDEAERLTEITALSYDEKQILDRVRIHYAYENCPNCTIELASGKKTRLYFADGGNRTCWGLKKIEYADGTKEFFEYSNCGIEAHTYPDGTHEEVIYTLLPPYKIAEIKKGDATTSFAYSPLKTDVRDSEGHLTEFFFAKEGHTSQIRYFEKKGDDDLFLFSEHYSIGSNDNERKLIAKYYLDKEGNPFFARRLHYDGRGNVIKESIFGHITNENRDNTHILHGIPLEGLGDSYSIYYEYDDYNRMTKKTYPNGLVEEVSYLTNTLLPTLIKQGKREHHFVYDHNQQLVQEKTGEKILEYKLAEKGPGAGMPIEIAEKDTESHPIQTTTITYSGAGLIQSKKIQDPSGSVLSWSFFEYDNGNRVTRETFDRHTTEHSYDARGRKVETHVVHSDLKTNFHYDEYNKLTKKVTSYPHAAPETIYYEYDSKGRKIAEISPTFHKTSYSYDRFNRVISVIEHDILLPDNTSRDYKSHFGYDLLGNKISFSQHDGNKKEITWNILRKPLHVTYENGAVEHYYYFLDGNLKKSIDPLGYTTDYSYDIYNRILISTCYEYPGETLFYTNNEYDAYFLLKMEDSEENTHLYTYDARGRVQTETINRKQYQYTYDGLSRIVSTKVGNLSIKTAFNQNNNPLFDVTEDGNGNTLSKKTYEYDQGNNLTTTTIHSKAGNYREECQYDAKNRLILKKNSAKDYTKISYQNNQTFITDSNGILSIETYDPLGRKIHQEKIFQGKTIQKEAFIFDGPGNLTCQWSHLAGSQFHQITTLKKYDATNQITSLTEAAHTKEEKTTQYQYDKSGNLIQKTLPNGTRISYTYDHKNRLIEERSSDKTIHYKYTYANGHLTHIFDQIHKIEVSREHDRHGNLLNERYLGHTFWRTYDALDRKTSLTLPDHSRIAYSYDDHKIRSVVRNHWRHTYDEYDFTGKLLKETLPYSLGEVLYGLDDGLRTYAIVSDFHSQYIKYGPTNLVEKLVNDKVFFNIFYNPLQQLTKDHYNNTYAYNSHFARTEKNHAPYKLNHLHQVVKTFDDQYTYDANGNLTKKSGATFYHDARGRITQIETDDGYRLIYRYDCFDRRIQKILLKHNTPQYQYDYLWDDDREIGLIDGKNNIIELRILGIGKRKDLASTVAIELSGKTYIPLHDLFGNITHLIDPETRKVTKQYHYTPFGEDVDRSPYLSPWTYQSKRIDPETRLIYFGKRYYDPEIGMFLTPDPSGFKEIPNLYHYTNNNPFTYFDPDGLEPVPHGATTCPYTNPTSPFNDTRLQYSWAEHLRNAKETLFTEPHFHIIKNENRIDGLSFLAQNGMCNTFEEAKESFTKLSNALNIEIHYVYNAFEGYRQDIQRAAMEKISGFPSAAVYLGTQQTKQELLKGNIVIRAAHSEGVLQVQLGLKDLPAHALKNLHIIALGGATIISDPRLGSVQNFISRRDPIPFLTCGLEIYRARKNNSPHVTLLDPEPGAHPYFDHSFNSPTYQKALIKSLKDIIDEYGK